MAELKKISTILIANRGEIALRIQATCHALGLKTVAIYVEEDQQLSFVHSATKSFKLPGKGSQGYLDQVAIISIAKQAGVDAVHPGYGFLSEKADFAQKVIDAGLVWVGPNSNQIALLGDKTQAHTLAKSCGIQTVPGYYFDLTNPESLPHAKDFAQKIGFPVILKCAHGGGGKAMRKVNSLDEFDTLWERVASESKVQFHSTTLLLEKYVLGGHHIEVQIAGDGKDFIHLYERECSVQRRHQKIIEETPSIFIAEQTRQNLFTAALKIAAAVNYENVGTVEFLVTPNQEFYFLEVNTRLQVEHSVTELTTGLDLVALQLLIAETKKLPISQQEISQRGHAIECRIYSENCRTNFSPSTGTITNLVFPQYPFLRIDHDLEEKQEITPFFDPMLGKLTVYGQTRELARKNMILALANSNIAGVETNLEFLQNLLATTDFIEGSIHTQRLNDKDFLSSLIPQPSQAKQIEFSEQDKKLLLNLFTQANARPAKAKKGPSAWRQQQW